MTDTFVWQDEYRIGIDAIDRQHQNLFQIARRLQAQLSPGQLQEELMFLYRHTREHFAAEEELMRENGYPGYREHQRQHDELLSTLNQHTAAIVQDPARLGEFQEFLSHWIVQHILDRDQRIAEYLRARDAVA